MHARFDRLSKGRFAVIGRAGLDLYAAPPGAKIHSTRTFTTALGGSSANIAVGLARQGCTSSLVTRLSDDAVGAFVLNQLKRYGVDRTNVHIQTGEARTSLALVETLLEDTQSIIYRNGAADFDLTPDDIEKLDWRGFDAVVVTGTALAKNPSREAVLAALERGRAAGLTCVLDIDYRPYSWSSPAEAQDLCARAAKMCDIVIGNDVEFSVLAAGRPDTDESKGQAAAQALLAEGVSISVYKRGEKGATTYTAESAFTTPIYPTSAIKPTGAGDAFMGGFLAALTRGKAIRDAVLCGSAAAAIVVSRVGCAPAMPDLAELDQFMASHPSIQPS